MCFHREPKPILNSAHTVREFGNFLIEEYYKLDPDSRMRGFIKILALKEVILGEMWRVFNNLTKEERPTSEINEALEKELERWESMGAWEILPRKEATDQFAIQLRAREQRIKDQAFYEWGKKAAARIHSAPPGQKVFIAPPKRTDSPR